MGVQLEWDANKQIAIIHVVARWTWEEYKVVVDDAFDQIRALNYPVAIIADIARMGQLPSGNFLAKLQYSQAHTPKNARTTVLVGAPHIVTTFLNVVMKVKPDPNVQVLFTATVEEAITLLQQQQKDNS